MPQFRNVGADAVFVSDLNATVESDALVDVPGDITDEADDHYLVEVGGVVRAWPKAQWADETSEPAADEDAASDDEEN